MCGIAGVVSSSNTEIELSDRAERMTAALAHRGPDGQGIRVFSHEGTGRSVALGHRRLAIIDLSPAGLQPMCNEDESVWIVFNGEIYNFQALRTELRAKGHVFRSNTDSEVLVHLYEELGPALVQRLTGIFAFAILDRRRRRVLLARDHMGIKPLYYRVDEDGLRFASEIKGILSADATAPAPNWQAVYDYFTYLYVPAPQTAFEGILQLPPAHTLEYDVASGEHEVSHYWTVRRLDEMGRASPEELSETLFHRVEDAVQRELVSDVPLGLFLSGGIDSSLLAGLAGHLGVKPRTFTVDFTAEHLRYYSEAKIAGETSRYLQTEHLQLDVDAVDPIEMLGLIDYFDEPFGNPTFYLQWMIARESRQHMTVALSGGGGDELFAGYPRYRAAQLARAFHHVPSPLLRGARFGLNLLKDNHRTMRLRRLREFLDGLDDDPVQEFTKWTYYMTSADKAALFETNRTADALPSERYLRRFYDESPFSDGNRLLHVDCQSFLVDNLLQYTDRMSMAVGMEVRVPFLEPDLVEFSLNIPFSFKLDSRQSKKILRDTFRQFITPSVHGAPKRGFNAPLATWIREDLEEYFLAAQDRAHPLRDRLGGDIGLTWGDAGILSSDHIERMRAEHREGRQDLSHELFAVITFDVWWRKYITQTLPIEHWSADHALAR